MKSTEKKQFWRHSAEAFVAWLSRYLLLFTGCKKSRKKTSIVLSVLDFSLLLAPPQLVRLVLAEGMQEVRQPVSIGRSNARLEYPINDVDEQIGASTRNEYFIDEIQQIPTLFVFHDAQYRTPPNPMTCFAFLSRVLSTPTLSLWMVWQLSSATFYFLCHSQDD